MLDNETQNDEVTEIKRKRQVRIARKGFEAQQLVLKIIALR